MFKLNIKIYLCAIFGLLLIAVVVTYLIIHTNKDNNLKIQIGVISPNPQSVKTLGDGFELTKDVYLRITPNADEYSISALKALLVDFNITDKETNSCTTIYIGQGNDDIANILKVNGIDDIENIKSEGYILASKKVSKNKNIVILAGKDNKGTFYAVQTLRQLLTYNTNDNLSLPEVEIRDYPSMSMRGSIEGFYGDPWTHEDRLSQIEFYGRNKMNTYIYAPKDDLYHREKWKELYPDNELQRMKGLLQKSNENQVDFVFALSPGVSIKLTDTNVNDADFNLLINKTQQMYDLGVRSFAIFLDDIVDYTNPNRKYHTLGQVDLLNRFETEFIKTHEGCKPLITVPTDYCTGFMVDKSDNLGEYIKVFGQNIDPDIIIMWTGTGVVSATITKVEVERIQTIFKNKILVWYNYPVNDMARNRLFMGPTTGLSNDLGDNIIGITSNPMNESESSKIPLYTIADYTWNTKNYDSKRSWENAINNFGGDASKALYNFSDSAKSSLIDDKESVQLDKELVSFWSKYNNEKINEKTDDVNIVIKHIINIRNAPSDIRNNLKNKNFTQEVAVYLDKLELLGKAAESSVKMLCAQSQNDLQLQWKYRLETEDLYNQAQLNKAVIGSKVIEPFIQKALEESNKNINVSQQKISTITNSSTYQNYTPEKMVDTSNTTFYWTAKATNVGDFFGIDLGATKNIKTIKVLMGNNDSDYMHKGTLEYSLDAKTWSKIKDFDNTPDLIVDNLSVQLRYVRCRSIGSEINWLKVRDFQATSDSSLLNEVTGLPKSVEDSPMKNILDGDITTAYRASNNPQAGDEIVCDISSNKPTTKFVVLQDVNNISNALVFAKNDKGEWAELGTLSKGYNEFISSSDITQVKLKWNVESSSPVIYEIYRVYLDK